MVLLLLFIHQDSSAQVKAALEELRRGGEGAEGAEEKIHENNESEVLRTPTITVESGRVAGQLRPLCLRWLTHEHA